MEQKEQKEEVCGAAVAVATTAPPAAAVYSSFPAFPIFQTILAKRSQATTWILTDAQISEWASVFTGVNVAAECRKAHSWIKADPASRRKSAGGMMAFLYRWLTKAQEHPAAARAFAPGSPLPRRASATPIINGAM